MATSLEESEKLDLIKKTHANSEKVVKIGPVDTEIALLIVKKKKLTQAKYIALPASLPSGLKIRNNTPGLVYF